MRPAAAPPCATASRSKASSVSTWLSRAAAATPPGSRCLTASGLPASRRLRHGSTPPILTAKADSARACRRFPLHIAEPPGQPFGWPSPLLYFVERINYPLEPNFHPSQILSL